MKYVVALVMFLSFSAVADVIVKTGSGCPAFVEVIGTSTETSDKNFIIDICKISYIYNYQNNLSLYMDGYRVDGYNDSSKIKLNYIYVKASNSSDILEKLPMAQVQNVEPSQ